MHSLNISLFYAINDAAGIYTWLDAFFVALTLYGIDIIAAFLVYFLFYTVPRRAATVVERFHVYLQGLEITFSTFLAWFVVHCIKVLVQSPRPFTALLDVRRLITETDYSFPSGHAAVAFAIATSVYVYHPKLGKILFVFAFLIAISRVYVGVHYPVDVVVGGILGVLIALFIHHIGRRKVAIVEAPDIPRP